MSADAVTAVDGMGVAVSEPPRKEDFRNVSDGDAGHAGEVSK